MLFKIWPFRGREFIPYKNFWDFFTHHESRCSMHNPVLSGKFHEAVMMFDFYRKTSEVKTMKRIKIRLDVPESTVDYYHLMEQWENEGGAIPVRSKEDLIPSDQIPFSAGDTIRIVSGSVDLIEDEFYYIVDVDLVSKADAVLKEHDESRSSSLPSNL